MAAPRNIKKEIFRLRQLGYSYRKIAATIPCSKSTVSVTLSDGQLEKTAARTRKRRASHPYVAKSEKFQDPHRSGRPKAQARISNCTWQESMRTRCIGFRSKYKKGKKGKVTGERFTYHDVIKKYGENPNCYLTGRQLDIKDKKSYAFDHIIPRSKGGGLDLDNLGIACKEANEAKSDLLIPEFVKLCADVIKHIGSNFGYEIVNNNN